VHFFVGEAKFPAELNFQQQQPNLAAIVSQHCVEISKASFQWAVTGCCGRAGGDQCFWISGPSCLRCDTEEL